MPSDWNVDHQTPQSGRSAMGSQQATSASALPRGSRAPRLGGKGLVLVSLVAATASGSRRRSAQSVTRLKADRPWFARDADQNARPVCCARTTRAGKRGKRRGWGSVSNEKKPEQRRLGLSADGGLDVLHLVILVSCHASSGASEFAMRVNARRGPQGISGILARATTRQWRAWRTPEGRDRTRVTRH